jgi:nudix-type nucleoside diphosphatase (YffH/AdpP family)
MPVMGAGVTDAILSAEPIHRGWFDVTQLRLRLAGQECERALVEHPHGAALLPYDPDRRVAAVLRQTRPAMLFLGLPALTEAVSGVVDPGEPPADAARRETWEEVGIRLRSVEPVGAVWMTPCSTTEKIHLFLGEYAAGDRVGEGGGIAAELEVLDVREEPIAALWRQAEAGAADAKLFMLLHALRLRRPELF